VTAPTGTTGAGAGADAGWVLVVGGSHAEIPLIRAAQRRGYRVATTGNRPADLGHPHADRYLEADFSAPDQVLEVARTVGAVGIVSGCNDFAALSTAQVAADLGLPGHDPLETSLELHHKDRFRHLLERLALPSPAARVVTGPDEAVAFAAEVGCPVIVKPVDLTGGKGMTVCHRPDEVRGAAERALAITRQDHVVVEQFLVGTNHGFTCFVHDGRVGFWFADDEQYYLNAYLVSGTTTPTSMPPSAVDRLVGMVERIAAETGLVDGLVHIQCIVTERDVVIVELCRRCPGDLYPWFVSLSTGFDYADAVVASELGLVGPTPAPGPVACIGRHCLMAAQPGTLEGIDYPAEVRDRIVEEMLWWEPGLQVTDHLVQKFGIVFLRYRDAAEMHTLTPRLPDLIATRIATRIATSIATSTATSIATGGGP